MRATSKPKEQTFGCSGRELGKLSGYCPGCGVPVTAKELDHHCSRCGHMLRLSEVKVASAQKASVLIDVQGRRRFLSS